MSVASVETSGLWDLAPAPARVTEIDARLRLRLADSFEYLGGLGLFDDTGQATLRGLIERLKAGPVSPWVFCLYARLVAELSQGVESAGEGLDALAHAAALPAGAGVIPLLDPSIPTSWWDQFQVLIDTDQASSFRPGAPAPEQFSRCRQDIDRTLERVRRIDPVLHDEIRSLLRSIVLGSSANLGGESIFTGASTFFLWGATLINADFVGAPLTIVDLLVHESSHVLLFGLSFNEGLTRNPGEARYDSPVRSDKRPIDGIFHACFVTTRVHLAVKRLLDSGLLDEDESKLAIERCRYNEKAGREALAVLARHAEPTRLGKAILDELEDYWAHQPVGDAEAISAI
jgi:HEXXH motif-containing protein